ncbi:hypothetical protein P692DRAFT_20745087 [Suillus brevipes Sb2]|nr:hypothetical protein P692DRAFT_20745087 [Suillus brevipes Sb2]
MNLCTARASLGVTKCRYDHRSTKSCTLIMNSKTHTYLNVLNFQVMSSIVVCSMFFIRWYLFSSQWNVGSAESCGLTIQSFGTGASLSFDRSDRTDTTLGQRCHQYLD